MRFPFIVLIVSALSSILIINQVAGTKGQYEKVLEKGREHRREEQGGAVNAGNSAIGWRRKRNIRGKEPARICLLTKSLVRGIFVWRWNRHENARRKQQTNKNRAIWLVYRTDTNLRSGDFFFFLAGEKKIAWSQVKRIQTPVAFGRSSKRRVKNTSCTRTFQKSIDSPLWRHTTTRLVNRTMSSPYKGFLWRENEESMFWSFHPLADKTKKEHLTKPFSRSRSKISLRMRRMEHLSFALTDPLPHPSRCFSGSHIFCAVPPIWTLGTDYGNPVSACASAIGSPAWWPRQRRQQELFERQ